MYEVLKTVKREPKTQTPLNKLRNDGWVPGVIYGKGMESLMVQVELKALRKFFGHNKSKVFEVEVEGDKKHLVSLDKVEKDHVGQKVMHISFHHLERGQATHVMVPVVMEGSPVGVKKGGIINQLISEVECIGLPTDIPESIVVNCSELDVHEHINLSQVTPPKGVKFKHFENDQVLFSVSMPKVQVFEEATETTTEAPTPVAATSAEDKEAA